MRKLVVSLAMLLAASGIFAEDVTLPAAASIVGGAPFFSDVRAFNTSYASALDVTAHYHCFIPSPCTPTTGTVTFTLAPRLSERRSRLPQPVRAMAAGFGTLKRSKQFL